MPLIDRTLLPQFISQITGVPTKWLNNQRDFVSPTVQAAIYLQVTQLSTVGVDDQRQDYNAETGLIETTQVGYRPFILTCRIESYQELPAAYEYADLIQTNIFQECYLQPLREANIIIIQQPKYVDLPVYYDDRAISVCSIDIKCVAQGTYSNSSASNTTWIETVGLVDDLTQP